MKRREFLKILGFAPAVAAVPVLAKANEVQVKIEGGQPDMKKFVSELSDNVGSLWFDSNEQRLHVKTQTSWEPVKQSDIDTEPPITKTLLDGLNND